MILHLAGGMEGLRNIDTTSLKEMLFKFEIFSFYSYGSYSIIQAESRGVRLDFYVREAKKNR